MAVHIKLIKNNIKSSSSYGKYFAKTVSSLPVVASRAAISSTTSAKVSKPSGRRVLNLRVYYAIRIKT